MKRLLLLAICCLAIPALYAADFGFSLDNLSSLTNTNNFQLSQKDRAEAWVSSTGDTYAFQIDGFYEFNGDFNASGSAIIPYRFDVGRTYLYLLFPRLIDNSGIGVLTLGRFDMSDNVNRIVSGLSDGAQFALKFASSELTLQAGYTGLINKTDANIVISQSDLNESFDPIYYFAPTRVFAGFKAKFLEVLDRHDFDVELHGQFDLRPNDVQNTQYLEVGMEGRPERWFKWRAYVIGEAWENPIFNLSAAVGVRFQFSIPEAAGLVILINADWASGSSGGLRAYAPLNQTPVAFIYRASFTDIIATSLNATIRPVEGINTGLSAYGLFRASNNLPSDPLFPAGSNSLFLGFEALLNADITITSDLLLTIRAGGFFPNTSDAYLPGTPSRWLANIDLKLSI